MREVALTVRDRAASRREASQEIPRGLWVGILIALILVGIAARGSWSPAGGPMKEEVNSIVFAPLSAGVYYAFAGTTRYGVYYTVGNIGTNTWNTWAQTGLDQTALQGAAVTSVIASSNFVSNHLVLAGASNGQVYWSTDSGGLWQTWHTATGLPAIPEGNQVRRLVYEPTWGVFACTTEGLYLSTDGGQSYSLFSSAGYGTMRVSDLAFDPASSSGAFFICTEEDSLNNSGGLYEWTGAGWTDLSGNLPSGALFSFEAVEVSNLGGATPGYIWLGDTLGRGLLESKDGGASWHNRCVNCEKVLEIDRAPDFSASNEHFVFGTQTGWWEAGLSSSGVPVCKLRFPQGLTIHELTQNPAWSAPDNQVWAAATADGPKWVFSSGYTAPIDGNRISIMDASDIVPSPNVNTDGTIFALSRRYGLFISPDFGQNFYLDMPAFQNATNPASLPAAATAAVLQPGFNSSTAPCDTGRGTIYLSFDGKGVYRSTNVGLTWGPLNAFTAPAPPSGVTWDGHISCLVHTPSVGAYPLFAGSSSSPWVFRYNTTSFSWEYTADLPASPPPASTKIICLGMPPSHASGQAGNIFAGTDSALYRLDAAGMTWTAESLPGSGAVTAIVFDPNYNGTANQTMFATRYGSGIYRYTCQDAGTCLTWAWVKVSADGMDLHFTSLAISPNYASAPVVVAGSDNPASNSVGGVYISVNAGGYWLQSNGTSGSLLSDLHIEALSLYPGSSGGLRLACGTRREKVFCTDSLPISAWQPSGGFSSGLYAVNAVAISPVPGDVGCAISPSYTPDPGGDVFIGGSKGVLWSNDGGDTFRPINQGFTGGGLCQPTVNCLLAIDYNLAGTLTPVLLAGTDGRGIWYRAAVQDPTTGNWDWTDGQWVLSSLGGGTINHFTRDDLSSTAIFAASDAGNWKSTDGGATWVPLNQGLPGGADLLDVRFSQTNVVADKGNRPKAPSGSSVWGTVNHSGVYQGGDSSTLADAGPEGTFRWVARNGSGSGTLANLESRSVIQLSNSSLTVLCGTNSPGQVYRTDDQGTAYWEPSTAGLESICGGVTDFLEACNGDVLCSVDAGMSACGGVYLSGDRGRHWVNITSDLPSQDLSTVVADKNCPPTYYSGTQSNGAFGTVLTALPYPSLSSVSPATSPSTGGVVVTVVSASTDPNPNHHPFQPSCPDGYGGCNGQSQAVVTFGNVDAATTYIDDRHLQAACPAHPGGTVSVGVRNPDTRTASWAGSFTYTEVEGGTTPFTITLTKSGPGQVNVHWENGPGGASGTRAIFRSPKPDFSVKLVQATGSGPSGDWSDSTGAVSDGYLYFYKVE